jgi:hypothetical protein
LQLTEAEQEPHSFTSIPKKDRYSDDKPSFRCNSLLVIETGLHMSNAKQQLPEDDEDGLIKGLLQLDS